MKSIPKYNIFLLPFFAYYLTFRKDKRSKRTTKHKDSILVGDDERSEDLVPDAPVDQIIYINCVLQEGDSVMIKVVNSTGDMLVEHLVEMRRPTPEVPIQRVTLQ